MLVLAELLVRASPAWASEADLEAWEAGWWPAGNSAPSAEAWWEAPSAGPSPPPFLLLSLPSWGSSCHMPPRPIPQFLIHLKTLQVPLLRRVRQRLPDL